jgi:Fe-S cluster assembly iron-binding protein IscA
MRRENSGGFFMLELSESARKELEAYFADKERGNIRIYLAPGG